MMMGTTKVSVNHLKSLVQNVQKSVHGLSQMDVRPIDKMSFRSFEKITEQRVIDALSQYVPNSSGTIKFMRICKDVTSCYLELDMSPLERIHRMWRSLYFLRIWRRFIVSSRGYTLANNFITSNAYTCIEINAQNLIVLIKKFRDRNTPEQFLPVLFDSQSCEKMFRHFRSMGTAKFTKINFSLYELLHIIRRIEVQNEIAYFKLKDIEFPNKRSGKTQIYPLPSDAELNVTLARAKAEAVAEAALFGMNDVTTVDDFQIKSNLKDDVLIDENCDDDVLIDESYDDDFALDDYDELAENENFDENIDENAPFTYVYDENNVRRIIRKSTLIWMLCEPFERLTNDRLRRFKRKLDD